LLRFQVDKRINESILLQKWLRKASNVEDDAYETPIFANSKELDVLVSTSSIIKNDVEEENSPPYLEDAVMDSKEEMTNMENSTPTTTPQSATNSNEHNEPLMEPSSAQYVRKKCGDTSEIGNIYKGCQENLTSPCR